MIQTEVLISDVDSIRSAFSTNKITAREAAELLGDSKIKKPWHTKEWREQRSKLLMDKCVQCGSGESPFVLQHLWQPRKLSDIAKDERYKIRPVYEAQHPIPQAPMPKPDLTSDACPSCRHLSIYWRKTTQDWRCGNSRCKNIFNKPVIIPVHSHEQMASWREKQHELKHVWYEKFREATEEQVLSKALLIAFSEHDRYLTLKDTTTFCVKCAFMWDKRGKKLCSGCKKFIPIFVDENNCFNCLDDEFGFMSGEEVYRMYTEESKG